MNFVYSFATNCDGPPGSPLSRHTACLTCKNRHKKCDEKRPRCDNCTRLNLECKQPDLFRASRLSRGYRKRRSLANTNPDEVKFPENQSGPDQNTESSLGRTEDATLASSSTISDMSYPVTAVYEGIAPSPAMTLSPIESRLMQHYIERLSSILINIDDGPLNVLKSISFPRMMTSPMLTDALYATSARHLLIYEGKPEYQIASLKYYSKASKALRVLIFDFGPNLSVHQRELMLLTSVFLCKYEIISGEVTNWRPHLRGLQKIFTICQRDGITVSNEMVSYIQSFVAYHWYIAGITRTEKLSTSSVDAESDGEIESEIVINDHIDPYMGFSGRFVSGLNSVAKIIMLGTTEEFDVDTILYTTTKAIHIINADPYDFGLSDSPYSITPGMLLCLGHIASGYRHALILYLHLIVERLIKTHSDTSRILQFRLIRSLLPCSKEDAVSACLDDVLRVPEHSSASIGSAPLLFIIASETKSESEFETAFNLLMRLWKRTGLGNTGVALDFLRQVQDNKFSDWRQILKGRNWDLIVS